MEDLIVIDKESWIKLNPSTGEFSVLLKHGVDEIPLKSHDLMALRKRMEEVKKTHEINYNDLQTVIGVYALIRDDNLHHHRSGDIVYHAEEGFRICPKTNQLYNLTSQRSFRRVDSWANGVIWIDPKHYNKVRKQILNKGHFKNKMETNIEMYEKANQAISKLTKTVRVGSVCNRFEDPRFTYGDD